MSEIANNSMLIERVRVRYCHLHELRASKKFPTSAPSVEIVVLLRKDDPQFEALQRICWAAVQGHWGDRAQNIYPTLKGLPWKGGDGDGKIGIENPKFDEPSKGHWQCRFRNNAIQPVVGPDGPRDVINPSDIYPGCWVNVYVHSFVNAQHNTFSCWFDGVQFVDNDERFAGGAPALENMFGVVQGGQRSNARPQAVSSGGMPPPPDAAPDASPPPLPTGAAAGSDVLPPPTSAGATGAPPIGGAGGSDDLPPPV